MTVAGAQVSRRTALATLIAINLLNYLDRYIIAALLMAMQAELHFGDARAGLLATAFMLVYFVSSPFFGWVGDRGRRPAWLAFGVAGWSLATACTSIVHSFTALLVSRAAVGIGEAAYGSIAPSLLADYFPKAARSRVLSYFYVAIPVGSALGYLLGGQLGGLYGWRVAFLCVGVPGLLLSVAALRLPEPQRGAMDSEQPPESLQGSWFAIILALWRNRLYRGTVAGYCAYTFAIGAMAFWMPSYMVRERGLTLAHGSQLFGAITVVTGLSGTLMGSALADVLLRRSPKGYTQLNTLSMVGAACGSQGALSSHSMEGFLIWLALAQLCMFFSTGPVNALIINSVPPTMRATAMAVSIFFIHLLGDACSPALVGHFSERHGLQQAMLLIPAVFLLAALLWGTTLPRRRQR